MYTGEKFSLFNYPKLTCQKELASLCNLAHLGPAFASVAPYIPQDTLHHSSVRGSCVRALPVDLGSSSTAGNRLSQKGIFCRNSFSTN